MGLPKVVTFQTGFSSPRNKHETFNNRIGVNRKLMNTTLDGELLFFHANVCARSIPVPFISNWD
jgi:hypothetical protein